LKTLQYKPRSIEALWHLTDLKIEERDLDAAEKYYKGFSQVLPKGKDNADQLLLAYRLANASGNNTLATRYAARLKDKFPNSEQVKKL